MANQRNALRAGLFMVISLALVILVIIAISGAGRFTQSFTTYPVAFSLSDDIGGLRVGDDVRVGGLKVGGVRDIEIRQLDSAAGQSVVVFIDLPSRFPVATDASVSVEKSLTGTAAINIDSLGTGPRASPGEYLHGRPDPLFALIHRLGSMEPDLHQIVANVKSASVKLDADLDKFGQTADAFTETGFTAAATVHDLHVRLPDIVRRYNNLTASAVRMLDAVHEMLAPSTSDFHTAVANVRGITGDLRQRLPGLLDQMRSVLQKTDLSVTRAAAALADIQSTVADTKELSASLRSVISGNQSKLDAMIASLKSTSDNLKYASMEIRHSPWRLLYQPKAGEVANLNTYDSVRQFAEGASSLDDAAAALRDALKQPNADPEQVKKLMSGLDASFSRFQSVEQKLWKDIQQ
ncbi:MAG: MlaD family protein [Tepidisphaeraceae bacterium]|jgi:ABC-type transporter Mla subunit MlaD